jgi:hypothetical protein
MANRALCPEAHLFTFYSGSSYVIETKFMDRWLASFVPERNRLDS